MLFTAFLHQALLMTLKWRNIFRRYEVQWIIICSNSAKYAVYGAFITQLILPRSHTLTFDALVVRLSGENNSMMYINLHKPY
jgi:hypothetical protein